MTDLPDVGFAVAILVGAVSALAILRANRCDQWRLQPWTVKSYLGEIVGEPVRGFRVM